MLKKIRQLLWKFKYNESPYVPKDLKVPVNMIDVVSGWKGTEMLIDDIVRFAGIETNVCLEFGVDTAYSTVAFSNYFKTVVGVDTFQGDIHSGPHSDNYDSVKTSVRQFPNIQLVQSDYKVFIEDNKDKFYDLIHVDIIHTYEDTYKCGLWAAQHANCVLFHDTVSYREVIRAVKDISKETGMKFYNYREKYGLGILCNK